ncbi:MAG: hypothetical protein JO288_11605 [Hyphomicrobiales bacterium]|nr:hypothetical protein [Hyphomicrobiales bacterium]
MMTPRIVTAKAAPLKSDPWAEVRKTISYKITFRRKGRDLEALYWAGSLAETEDLAEKIALECGADDFRIVEFASDAEV